MAVEALAPPDAARVAIRIATRVATVYTNAPKWLRGAISTDLCTLLRRRRGGDATTHPHELTKPQFLVVTWWSNKSPDLFY